MDRLVRKVKSSSIKFRQVAWKMCRFVRFSVVENWFSFVVDNFPTLSIRTKMLDENGAKFLEFYGSIFMRHEDRTKVVYDLNVKLKLLIMFMMVLEIAKNLVLIRLPMSDVSRYWFCELLISIKDDEQRSLNFIIILAMSSFTVYLVLLIRLDKQKLLSWIDFLVLEGQPAYAAKHHLSSRSVKLLFLIYQVVMFITKCASFFYLLVCYIYYARSFKLSLEKGVNCKYLLLIFLPSALVSVHCISLYYVQSTKNCTLFILYNLFLAMKLDKLSDDLRRYEPKKRNTFHFEHLKRFQKFLNDFEDSQVYFNYCLFR